MSRKRRRQECNEKHCLQTETLYLDSSEPIEPQSISFPEETDLNHTIPSSMFTCSYQNGQKKRREE